MGDTGDRRRQWSRDAKILKLKSEGKSASKIAKELGIDYQVVKRVFDRGDYSV